MTSKLKYKNSTGCWNIFKIRHNKKRNEETSCALVSKVLPLVVGATAATWFFCNFSELLASNLLISDWAATRISMLFQYKINYHLQTHTYSLRLHPSTR